MRARYVVSGIDGGPDGSVGLGIARSIRLFDPEASITGIGYSAMPSAVLSETAEHSGIFDETHVFPNWGTMHLGTWAAQLSEMTKEAVLIPGLALEARILAQELSQHANVLAPDESCLAQLGRPAQKLARALETPLPPSLAEHSITEVSKFMRQCEHGAWVRGEIGGGTRVGGTSAALSAGRQIAAMWGTPWYLEAHVPGQACSLAFAARDGALIDAVFMAATEVTSGGTPWAGNVTQPPPALNDRLRTVVAELRWTGGGTLDLIRTWNGDLRLLSVKPTFPSWIHGAALAGFNLVGSLLSCTPVRTESGNAAFTRLVVEAGTPAAAVAPTRERSASVPALLKCSAITSGQDSPGQDSTEEPAQAVAHLIRLLEQGAYERDSDTSSFALETSDFVRRATRLRETLGPETVIGYSIKTFPHPRLMATAAELGLVAEATSQHELDAGVRAGFARRDAVLNGPAKWWPTPEAAVCGTAFADSLDELRMLAAAHRPFPLELATVGVRLQPSFDSRFGIAMDSAEAIERVADQLGRTAARLGTSWGVHFHHAEAVVGRPVWHREVERLARITHLLADALGTPPAVVDVGGGWHAEDFEDYRTSVAAARSLFPTILDGTTRLATEPGRVLTQTAGIRYATVLARRTDAMECDVVVDIGDPEMSHALSFDRPVAVLRDGTWTPLRRGTARVLGRTCQESDVLLTHVDTTDLRIGTTLAIGACGAYDFSMSYEFGRGAANG
ncbi:hypothetical protein [Streptomyces sp. V2I9]|uniref:hypothetical protein n=1 Tax=Streptomyces sp. V2I9 TaxID=3042304 RepID=UPI0027813719|nr:hypothetical protein [Streptomyces sp. V2I9]MDQ0987935.1 diaminopimelate decarboxylase [Streptomyces sp. V2I9]